MANDNEPAKLLLPYLQRADELQKHDPLVAYYCRLYAMERGLKIPQSERTKYTNSLLVSLMKQLEKDKKSLKLGPDDSLHLEGFALNVFAKADKQDRAGRADLNTAKTFYAASIFFEILNQFGELQPDVEQKQKYAAWKAVDIRKAMKEGRKPEPGPPGGDRDLSVPSITPSSEYDLEPNRIDPTTKHLPESDPSPHYNDQVDPQHFVNSPQPPPPSNIPQPPPSNIPPPPPSNIPPPPHYNDRVDPQHFVNSPPPQAPPTNIPPSPPSYPSSTYTSHDFHPPPSTTLSDNSSYSQSYHHQPYPQEPPQHFTQNYPSHDVPSYSYPNFQSYPSFTESNLPEAPSHYPSFNHGSEASYSNPSAPTKMDYPPSDQYDSGSRNGSVSEATPKPIQTYLYDSNYQPPPEKIAEAHKAARFAVGALAFDDVYIAVDYLKKSLELLTNPSAGQ